MKNTTGKLASSIDLLNVSSVCYTSKSDTLGGSHATESHLGKILEVRLLAWLSVNARSVRAGGPCHRSADSNLKKKKGGHA